MKKKIFEKFLWSFYSWTILDLPLISTKGKWRKQLKKFLNVFFEIFIIFFAMYIPILLTCKNMNRRKVLELIPHYIIGISVTSIYLSIRIKKADMKKITKRLMMYSTKPSEFGISKPEIYFITITLYLFALSVYILITNNNVMLLPDFIANCIVDKFLYNTIGFISISIYYIERCYFPALIGIAYYVMCRHIFIILSNFEEYLKSIVQEKVFSCAALRHFMKRYANFSCIIVSFNDLFSVPVFFTVVIYFIKMFAVLASALLNKSLFIYNWLISEILNAIIIDVLILYSLCELGNEIRGKMEKIHTCFSKIYENLLELRFQDKESISLIKHASLKNAVVLTAGGIFSFTRRSFTMAVGSLLTYSLLFVEIQGNWS